MADNNENNAIEEMNFGLKVGEPTALERATIANRERPLTADELSGFGKEMSRLPEKDITIRPFVKVEMPSKTNGHKGVSVVVGVKGAF